MRTETYMGDSVINGGAMDDVLRKTTETIECLKQGSFESEKSFPITDR